MKNQWKRVFPKSGLTFLLLAALLLAGCQTAIQAAPEDPPPEEPEAGTLPEPLTEEETMAIFEEVEPLWDTIEYDPADYTDWVEIDCNTQTGEGCLLPNGCDLSTGEGCTLPDGCNFVTREGCILPNGCNLETGEGCDLFDGCNPITFEGCPWIEGCDTETGAGCELPNGCNLVTGEGCELPNGCNPLTLEGCTIPYGDGSFPKNWDEIDAMWALVDQDWKNTEANAQWQEGYYSGLDLLTSGEFNGLEGITEEDIADFFNQ